jgi:hypothetical protein
MLNTKEGFNKRHKFTIRLKNLCYDHEQLKKMAKEANLENFRKIKPSHFESISYAYNRKIEDSYLNPEALKNQKIYQELFLNALKIQNGFFID